MKEKIFTKEQMRQPHADFNRGVHGEVVGEQALFSEALPRVEVYVLSQDETAIKTLTSHEDPVDKTSMKGGEIFHGN